MSHAEYHFMELLSINNKHITDKHIEFARQLRDTRVTLMEKMKEVASNIEPLWCTIKHLLLAHMSILETAEKYGSAEDTALLLKQAYEIITIIKTLLYEADLKMFANCSRCDKDMSADKE